MTRIVFADHWLPLFSASANHWFLVCLSLIYYDISLSLLWKPSLIHTLFFDTYTTDCTTPAPRLLTKLLTVIYCRTNQSTRCFECGVIRKLHKSLAKISWILIGLSVFASCCLHVAKFILPDPWKKLENFKWTSCKDAFCFHNCFLLLLSRSLCWFFLLVCSLLEFTARFKLKTV